MSYKKVYLPIKIPSGDFCCDGKNVCSYFDNYEGFPRCGLNLSDLHYDDEYTVRKPPECIELKEI